MNFLFKDTLLGLLSPVGEEEIFLLLIVSFDCLGETLVGVEGVV